MVYEAMKRIMIKSAEYKQSIYVKNLYSKLNQHHVGTSTVESLSRRICNKLPNRRKITLVNIIIKWKLQDAHEVLRRKKYENTKTWRENKEIIQRNKVLDEYKRLWKREISIYENDLNEKLKQKVLFLKEKYKKNKRDVPEEINGIIINDQELTNEYNSEPRIYGNIILNEKEKNLLSLTPKYTIFEKVDRWKYAVEIEKVLTKYRWEESSKQTEEVTNAENEKYYDIPSKTFRFNVQQEIHST